MALRAVFGGVSTVLVTDGESAVLVDGYFTRPSLPRLLLTRVGPDPARIRIGLERLGITRLDAVLASHSHVDHSLDAPVIAQRTGAVLAGTPSTRNIQLGYGLGAEPFVELHDGEPVVFGAFEVTPVRAEHSDDDTAPGPITRPLVPPARLRAFRAGGCHSFRIRHSDGSVLVVGTAQHPVMPLAPHPSDVLYLGVGGIGAKSEAWRADYWRETVTASRARVVRPIHWDAFWRPLTAPLAPLPPRLDRLETTMADLMRWARRDGVELALPRFGDEVVLGGGRAATG